MRKISVLLMVCMLLLSMSACVTNEPIVETTTQPTQATEPTVTEETVTDAQEIEHSSLYITGLRVEDVILYFNEVCLDAEFNDGGDPSRLQKWTNPIFYHIDGKYTAEDISVLNNFVQWLNTIEGFPGIAEAESADKANLQIHFCSQKALVSIMGQNFQETDGAVTFWYESHEIYEAVICYREDISQVLRNSVILEEIYNGLGPVQDTDLRQDSLIYSGYSEPQSLTSVDELILKLLYHPSMKCGMDRQACEQVIRQLYY